LVTFGQTLTRQDSNGVAQSYLGSKIQTALLAIAQFQTVRPSSKHIKCTLHLFNWLKCSIDSICIQNDHHLQKTNQLKRAGRSSWGRWLHCFGFRPHIFWKNYQRTIIVSDWSKTKEDSEWKRRYSFYSRYNKGQYYWTILFQWSVSLRYWVSLGWVCCWNCWSLKCYIQIRNSINFLGLSIICASFFSNKINSKSECIYTWYKKWS